MAIPYRFADLTGFVLAGGASRRMGRNKALLKIGGEAILNRQIRLLRAVCHPVAVLGPPGVYPGLDMPVIPDDLPGLGPLGGIYTGLRHTRTEFNLFLGCDLPFMEPRFLRYLCARALESRADVTVANTPAAGFQTLSAVYRRRARSVIRTSLRAGEYKIRRLFSHVHCLAIPWPEIVRAGFSPRIFDNMNTPADYEFTVQRTNS